MFKFVTMSVIALSSVCLSAYAQEAESVTEVEVVTADVAFDGSDAAEVASDSSSESNSDASAE